MNNKKFLDWLRKNGAEVLASTNPYEYARFIARGRTNIIYHGRRGISASGFAQECFEAFQDGKEFLSMGIRKIPRTPMAKIRLAIVERDGDKCFFCYKKIPESMMTTEHLISKQNGGPDHIDNLVLAHIDCNREAANLPLIKKIEIREKNKQKLHFEFDSKN